ncbi:short chain dehydrogenase [Mycolicibacterium rufum]|uniref:Short chain dehydrogenase n=1 Tax=Mycolicibacterium rufum TaxID=318424 RepID=A0A9X3BP83_9MYCO|nr:short-chain dehydrogenase [Mycolicibacterium rufum]KGI69100.1 short-chain dehydrogenase [Mycolicibacterium rufum]MCV7069985.1 short chain dehydrogenase [Mycolicibacterium rufum]ULP35282.1 short chain dehydrogenase [Mycolicibacterium rufum]
MSATPERVVLVSGGSRGLGRAVARRMGGTDGHVVIAPAGHAQAATSIVESVAAEHGRLDALVLDASECLSLAGDHTSALHAFRERQRALVEQAMSLMAPGARIVYVTSHQAHFFPHKAVPKGCTAAVASMRAGETALYAMRSRLGRRGIHLSVVSSERPEGGMHASMHELGTAVVNAVTARTPQGLVCVGGANYLMTA